MAVETLSLLFHSLPLLQLASYSNATTEVTLFFACYALYRAQPGREQVFCNVIISIFCGVVRICGVTGSCSRTLPQLQRFGDAIGQVTGITYSLLAHKTLGIYPTDLTLSDGYEESHSAY